LSRSIPSFNTSCPQLTFDGDQVPRYADIFLIAVEIRRLHSEPGRHDQ
jgi:hypothetical protein